jgi:hypothetical protein
LIREAKESDARLLLELLTNLDKETNFMLYEPGERKSTIEDIQLQIRKASDTSSILLVAEENEKIVGFLSGVFQGRSMREAIYYYQWRHGSW